MMIQVMVPKLYNTSSNLGTVESLLLH